MTQSEFKLLFANQVMKCEETLQNKRKEYTGDNQDRLSSFKIAASLQGCTPQRALVGMMAKHIVSLYDMCYAKMLPSRKNYGIKDYRQPELSLFIGCDHSGGGCL